MFAGLEKEHQEFSQFFEENLRRYLYDSYVKGSSSTKPNNLLWQSAEYSLKSGGKRFRPFLVYLVARTYGASFSQVFSWALAIEMIHTYSLIHDDLPCMDNDNFRRDKLTNHALFGEAIALLAGNSLLTEAFAVISSDDRNSDTKKIKCIQLLTEAVGAHGMMKGQILDMQAGAAVDLEALKEIHQLKTGALIKAAILGAAVLVGAANKDLENLTIYADNLGLAFQIKDDLLDGSDNAQAYKSYLAIFGIKDTANHLEEVSQKAISSLKTLEVAHASIFLSKDLVATDSSSAIASNSLATSHEALLSNVSTILLSQLVKYNQNRLK